MARMLRVCLVHAGAGPRARATLLPVWRKGPIRPGKLASLARKGDGSGGKTRGNSLVFPVMSAGTPLA
jgi:hypothetical protein